MSWSGGRSPRLPPGTMRSPSTRRLPLSSSELSPFSFSEDTIKILASDIERQNCLIPLNLPVNSSMLPKFQSSSQPQTPVITPLVDRRNPLSSSIDIRNPMSSSTDISFRSSDPPEDRERTLVGHSKSMGGGSLATPGRTMRDYDESFKEMKKENFNLKLRIFFLEERMGIGKNSPKEESTTQNIDLKVLLESSKQDLTEKAALLIEASQAVEDMEQRMKDQELKFKEQINNLEQRLIDCPDNEFILGLVPRKPLRSPGLSRRSNILFPSDREDITNNNNKLGVLEEQDEITESKKCDFEHEEKIRELELAVEATEAKLQQVKISLEMNRIELQTFTSTLVKREKEIETLKFESTKKDEETNNLLAALEKQTNAIVSQDFELGKCGAKTECLCGEDSEKMKEQLKLQIQERKMLLKRINMLKEQLTLVPSVDESKELESVQQLPELGIQCDLGHGPTIVEAYSSSVSRYRQMIVNLNKKLAHSTEFCQTLQEHMEEIVDTAEHAIEEGNMDIMKDVLVKSRSVSRNLSHDRHISIETSEEESIINSFDKKFDNPLSEASTWNMELPSFADMQLCTSPDLSVGDEKVESEDVCNNVIQHLSEQIELRDTELVDKCLHIDRVAEDLRQKDDIIRDQSETINEYRCQILKLEDGLCGSRLCPEMEDRITKRNERKQVKERKLRKKDKRSKVPDFKGKVKEAMALSLDSDTWSEPDKTVSQKRIGLPSTYPEVLDCPLDHFQSDSEHKQTNLGESCSSSCMSSSHTEISDLVDNLLHQIKLCSQLDSGIEDGDVYSSKEPSEHPIDDLELNLCQKCSSILPKDTEDVLKITILGLKKANDKIEQFKRGFQHIHKKLKHTKNVHETTLREEEEAKAKLNENYILIAKLSSENLRLLGEHSKMEAKLEDLERNSSELELRLEDEICSLTSKLEQKEKEVNLVRDQLADLEMTSQHLKETMKYLQRTVRQKGSPDTSSSFDFWPVSGLSPVTSVSGTGQESCSASGRDIFRPRAFSASTQGPSVRHLTGKLTDISSPDLGVELESDMFSSLERGKNHRVGSLKFDKIVEENKLLRKDKDVLTQKLSRSKSALEETLVRLSKSNIEKAGQISPAVDRRPAVTHISERGKFKSDRTPSCGLTNSSSNKMKHKK